MLDFDALVHAVYAQEDHDQVDVLRYDEAVEQDGVVGGRVGEDIVRGVHVERTFRNP